MSETPEPHTTSTPRARDLGIDLGGMTGTHNAITDVPGVEVGYVTLISGEGPLEVGVGPIRTGVTAILPLGREGVGAPIAAGTHTLNGNGELTGTAWIEESGALTTPVLLTNTHAVGACHRGVIDWAVRNQPTLAARWLLPVVGETYDGYLNDVNGDHVQPAHAVAAIDNARGGGILEGSVGGGTGMICYGLKAGSGTSSRVVNFGGRRFTVGSFVQANFGASGELTILGKRVDVRTVASSTEHGAARHLPPGAGSVIAVVATDAPLLPGQCKALARRVSLGLARTGTTGSHYSGDIFIAFSTANAGQLSSVKIPAEGSATFANLEFVPWGSIDAFYTAVVQSIEEAVLNSMVAARAMWGRDNHEAPALPHDAVTMLVAGSSARSSAKPSSDPLLQPDPLDP